MIILPIGTKSTLALKPMVTIGLIIANAIIAAFTFPLMHHAEKRLLNVQRQRYAKQVRLYLGEHGSNKRSNDFLAGYYYESIREIEEAENYTELEWALMETLTLAGASIEDIQAFEEDLLERTELDYADADDDSGVLFEQWKELKAKEEAVLRSNVLHSLGLVPNRMHRIYTFFTYLFLHGGIWHLLGNMLFLWIVGCLLEDSWGRLPFFVFYLFGGVFAGLVHCLQDTTSAMPLIGASGAIAALMGAFTIRHFWTRIKFFYFFMFFFRPYWGTFHLPAFVFLPFWFAEQVVYKYLTDFTGGSDVAYLAHIAGYTGGVVTALLVRAMDIEERYLTPLVQKKQVEAGVLKDPRFDRACAFLDGGNVERARLLFDQLLKDHPNDVDTMQDIALVYREKGMTEDYTGLTDAVLKNMLLKSRFEEAAALAVEITKEPQQTVINPQYLLRIGKWLTEQNQYGEAHDIYRVIIQSEHSPEITALAAIALAKLLSEKMSNIRDALYALEDARKLHLDPDWNKRIADVETRIREMYLEPSRV